MPLLSRPARQKTAPDRRSPLSGLRSGVTWLTVGATATLAGVALLGLADWGDRAWKWLSGPLSAPPPPPKVDVRSLTIDTIRGASALTTTVFAMEAIVPTSRERTIGNFRIGSTKLLYIAYGEVRAGIDLSKLAQADVNLVGDRLTLKLPPPEVLDRKIDVTRSQIYDYDRGFLGLGPDVAPDLVTLAQKAALDKVTEAACARGLLEDANRRAKTVVAQMLAGSTLPTTSTTRPKVEILTQPPGPCVAPSPAPSPADSNSPASPSPTEPASKDPASKDQALPVPSLGQSPSKL